MVKRGSAAILVFAFVVAAACGGSATPTSATPTGALETSAARTPSGTASFTPTAGTLAFGQILTSARASEYKVTYAQTVTGAGASTGEQSWYFKPPKIRYDFSSTISGQTSTVSLYALPDGTFLCFGGAGQAATCIGMSGLSTALQQNPAAAYQSAMLQQPDQYTGVLAETRQIAGQLGYCYDVKSAIATAVADRFCYTAQGIPLLQRFAISGGTWSLEATRLSLTVSDSDFTLPAKPTVIGTP